MEKMLLFLKPFGAWATGLIDSYRFNPFTRTTVHVVGLSVVLCILLLISVNWALEYTQDTTVDSISEHIEEAVSAIATTSPLSAPTTNSAGIATAPTLVSEESASTTTLASDLPQDIRKVRDRTSEYIFGGIIALTALFGYLIAGFALQPARTSLQFQKRFIGNVAHELRTPLSIIKMNTEVRLMAQDVPSEMRKVHESNLEELDRISEIINNLLSFDMLIRPNRIKRVLLDLRSVVETVVDRYRALASSRNVHITVTAPRSALILGNTTALEQVVGNLLKNAINYTPEDRHGTVTLSLAERPLENKVEFTIVDMGIGISEEDLAHIFEPFYRGDASRVRGLGTGTSGLGLAIVNEIVRLYKGSITIRSVVGQGTTIRITFPRAPIEKHKKTLTTPEEKSQEVSFDFSRDT